MNKRTAVAILAGLAVAVLRFAHRAQEAGEIAHPAARAAIEALRDEDLERAQSIYSPSRQQEAPGQH
jgi:hypothetical protein